MTAAVCSNCHRETSRLAARGHCARCDNYERRNGALPPPEPLRAPDGEAAGAQVVLRMTTDLRKRAEKAAKAKGLTLSEWVRTLMEAAL